LEPCAISAGVVAFVARTARAAARRDQIGIAFDVDAVSRSAARVVDVENMLISGGLFKWKRVKGSRRSVVVKIATEMNK
jgi:hypothetical protein